MTWRSKNTGRKRDFKKTPKPPPGRVRLWLQQLRAQWRPSGLGDSGKPENIVAYVVDLLDIDGNDLTKLTLTERKAKLENILKKSKRER